MDSGRILVTGATGTVGSRVLDRLAQADVTVRAATRNPDAGTSPAAEETVAFDFERPETWGPAFDGVGRLFLVRPPSIGRVGRAMMPALDAAERMGVERVVFLSVLGAERIPLLPHRRLEKHLTRSNMAWTFLRASFFMENLTGVHGREITDRGEIVVPAGDGATSFVAAADVAAVAATTLCEPGHRNRSYDVTGDRAVTFHEVADVLSETLDTPVTYPEPSLLSFLRYSRSLGRSWAVTLVMAGLYTTVRLGLAARVSDDVETISGRAPTDLAAWASENRSQFERGA